MRGAISKSGINTSLAKGNFGGQGVCRKAGSEGYAEKYRAVVDGAIQEDELVDQRWDKVEPALWRRRHSHSTHRTKVCADCTVWKNSA